MWKESKTNWWVKSTKKVCTALNYIEHFLILASIITGYVSISVFALTAGIKKNKSIIKKKKNKHDKIVLLAKSKLNSIKVF